ncbi:putative PEP-binding protein, partial [Streptomyces violascens]|uniref:putative PEP-binding protein n=1 Tax=Streptomyces violascens TaxID=67381 RepID=UPI0036BFFD86
MSVRTSVGTTVPGHAGVISQFEGYADLAELNWDRYRAHCPDIRRLDRILEAVGDSVNRYQASKQADALVLGYLFSPGELRCPIGTMIELPRAALTAGRIAGAADFFSFGTNDLTQTTWGLSRDDAEASFFPGYLDKGSFPASPFETLDEEGV